MTPLDAQLKKVANRDHRDEKPSRHQRPPWNGRHMSCRCPDSFSCKHTPCACFVSCLCLGSLLSLSCSVFSFLRTTKRPLCETVTEHNCGAPGRQIHAARWIGNRRHRTQKCNEENADLWNEIETVLRLTDTRRLEFVWVKGHATKAHINQQVTTTLNKGGNDAADALASATAAHHAAPRTLTDAAYERQRTALITHSFASELLFGRPALSALHEADLGELTDCAVVRDIPSTALTFCDLQSSIDGTERKSWRAEGAKRGRHGHGRFTHT